MADYKKRIVDAILADKLSYMGAVWVRGPKWCGKTTTCEQQAKSMLYLADPQTREINLLLANTAINRLLEGATPRLLDEWQDIPQLWDAVRFAVDHRDGPGQFMFTGSAVPPDADVNSPEDVRKVYHTGTGRIARINMRPMSLWESGESSGEVSLEALFNGENVVGARPLLTQLEDIAFVICRGGWPSAVDLKGARAVALAKDYVDSVVESDISRVDATVRNPERARRLLHSLARLQGTQASAPAIVADMKGHEPMSFSENTVYSYLSALGRIFVTDDMKAWCPNLRCKVPARTTDTRYFVDPSIAAAALRIGPGELMNDITALGLIFETMAARDLRVYAAALGGEVRHYLDKSGLECDAVICLENGDYGLVEIKVGGEKLTEKGASSLNRLADKIDATSTKPPKFKMVLTAVGDIAYCRPDGVLVCPISALRP